MSERLLIIDDELFVRELLQEMCNSLGYEATATEGVADLASLLARFEFSAALVDLKRGDSRGLEAIRFLREQAPDLAVVAMTGQPTVDDLIAAMRLGAFDFVVKPFRRREIADTLTRACANSRRNDEIRALRERVTELEAKVAGSAARPSRKLVIPRKRELARASAPGLEFMQSISESSPEDVNSLSAAGGSGSVSGK